MCAEICRTAKDKICIKMFDKVQKIFTEETEVAEINGKSWISQNSAFFTDGA